MVILNIIGIGVSLVTFLYFLLGWIWKSAIYKTAPQITFDAFKKLYALFPSKWDFCSEGIRYKGDNGWTYIEFKHYIDVIRYGLFKRKIEKNNDYLKRIQNEKKFIASIQKDIEFYRRENLSEVERLINIKRK